MKHTYYALIIILVAIVSGCKTSFRISVKEPEVVKIPEEVKRFGVVNNITSENSPEKVLGQILGTEQLNGNVVAAENAIDGILRSLEFSNYLHGETLDISDSLRLESGEINWEYIDSVCTALNLQGITEMVEIRTISPIGGTVAANVTGKRSSKLEGTLVVNFLIARTHETYERYSVRHYYNIPVSENTTIIDILSDVQKKREYYRKLGYNLGYKAGSLIYPNWVWVNRKFYNKGSAILKRAKPMIYKGNWDIAEETLIKDLDSRKAKVRARILFNLALVNEGQGEIDNAIDYAERSAIEGDKMANDYLRDLRFRKRQIEELNN